MEKMLPACVSTPTTTASVGVYEGMYAGLIQMSQLPVEHPRMLAVLDPAARLSGRDTSSEGLAMRYSEAVEEEGFEVDITCPDELVTKTAVTTDGTLPVLLTWTTSDATPPGPVPLVTSKERCSLPEFSNPDCFD
jgi:hypothetical protein